MHRMVIFGVVGVIAGMLVGAEKTSELDLARAEVERCQAEVACLERRLRAVESQIRAAEQDLARASASRKAAIAEHGRVVAQAGAAAPGTSTPASVSVSLVQDRSEQISSAGRDGARAAARLEALAKQRPECREALEAARARLAQAESQYGIAEADAPDCGPTPLRTRVWVLRDGREVEGMSAISCDGVTRITTAQGTLVVRDEEVVERP